MRQIVRRGVEVFEHMWVISVPARIWPGLVQDAFKGTLVWGRGTVRKIARRYPSHA